MFDLFEIVSGSVEILDSVLEIRSDYRLHVVKAALELVAGELDRIDESGIRELIGRP